MSEQQQHTVQTEKIVAVLEADESLIEGLMCDETQQRCGHSGRCAIGALLLATGAVTEGGMPRYGPEEYSHVLEEEYGLDFEEIDGIMTSNDGFITEDEDGHPVADTRDEIGRLRAQHVINFVRTTWPV